MKQAEVRIVTGGPSNGAKNLELKLNELGVKATRLNANRVPSKPLKQKATVKWGAFSVHSAVFQASKDYMINVASGDSVLNKLSCLQTLRAANVPCVDFTASMEEAATWLTNGERVYVRSVLRGSGGDGITVLENPGQEIPRAPLYTKGVKGKRREYRIHVFNHNGVKRFWIQQKLRRQGFNENEGYSNTIRNLEHGWVFAHNEITPPKEATLGAAVAAVEAMGLQFGAVDLIERDKGGDPFVLEINTAPGLEGATVDFYANCIKESLNVGQN